MHTNIGWYTTTYLGSGIGLLLYTDNYLLVDSDADNFRLVEIIKGYVDSF